tara:strand:+ start:300 stop:854 length:555 start_codon:yes stop_codon:yes gene_type:complete
MTDRAITPASHTAATGLIRTDPVALAVWQRLTAIFASWRLILFAGLSRRGLHQFSNDQLTPLTKASHWKIGLGLLGGLNDSQIDFVKTYAELNAHRVERIFRTYTLLLVTLPVGATIGLNEIDPEIWTRLGFRQIDTVLVILVVWAIAAGGMMAAAWRARDLADLLIFEQARRQLIRAAGAVKP